MSAVGNARPSRARWGRWTVVLAAAIAVAAAATGTALAASGGETAAPRGAADLGAPAGTSPASAGATLCGASWQSESKGESYQEALARLDRYYGTMQILRVFYPGLPAAWPGKVDPSGRPMIVSFKAAPADVTSGRHDAQLRRWFADAPKSQPTYWTFYHEPENNISGGEFTAEQYRQAWRHLAGLAREAGNPNLRATLILMAWTLNPNSHRDFRDYYPGGDIIDVLGWDAYNSSWDAEKPAYQQPASMFSRVVERSAQEGKPFGIAETGSPIIAGDDGTRRAAWLRELTGYLEDSGALWATYFDIDWSSKNKADYRLRDAAGQAAWREFCD